ncbi:MAG: hypothetical protein LAO03_22200 [Acidobacteriia bacterium]|nr:hypothetical protein [Terriglobia bacterium]MBZ5723060.1 hypothetical protein [Terriglobia bacterium]
MQEIAISGLLLIGLTAIEVTAQQMPAKPRVDTKEAKIARALSAAPANIAEAAKIVDRDENGRETVLREGHNGFTCFPGHPWVVDDISYCANADALKWEEDWHAHRPNPTNTQPGFEYMLAGGTYRSATDPYATSGTPFTEGPHWIILWPFDAATTGLPTQVKLKTGTWIMWAGTPYSHLMINQRP